MRKTTWKVLHQKTGFLQKLKHLGAAGASPLNLSVLVRSSLHGGLKVHVKMASTLSRSYIYMCIWDDFGQIWSVIGDIQDLYGGVQGGVVFHEAEIPAWMQNPTKDFQGKQWPHWPERSPGAMLWSQAWVPGELHRVTELQKKTVKRSEAEPIASVRDFWEGDDEKPHVWFLLTWGGLLCFLPKYRHHRITEYRFFQCSLLFKILGSD